MTRTAAKSITEPADGLPAPDHAAVPSVVNQPLAGLPSANIKHSAVLRSELENRLSQFVAGIAALTAELEGQQVEHDGKVADLNTKHEDALSEMNLRHDASKAELLRRIDDLQEGKLMLSRGLDVGSGQ